MRLKRRAEDGFNMSFLDVMACGLGAVILIFILVDFNAFTTTPSEEQQKLEQELANATLAEQALSQTLADLEQQIAEQVAQQQQDKSAAQTNSQAQQKLLQDISTQLAVVADLEQQIAAVAKQVQPDASVQIAGQGEQNYITGMKVEGKHIGILLDISASMMGDNLVEVLRAMAYPDQQKVRQAKWQRTLRVANWLLARVPKDAKVTVIAFSEQARSLGHRPVNSAAAADSLQAISKDIQALVPNGGTNLQVGLDELFKVAPSVSDVYLVTDGLPTLGDGLSVSCKGVLSKKKSISSECRQQLLLATISRSQKPVAMNVILLPIEGDPYASAMYWNWTQVTGGTFLAPAPEWP
ncbi:VWA domain-containing protein [Pseudoalteromonas fenneropenaei]|uniref:VWA domain-containing protein n=1 Tax=Pseudoalteromonas fenneropenaei TaxID=1737459 RepID=A0ABV7CN00_9GAMM